MKSNNVAIAIVLVSIIGLVGTLVAHETANFVGRFFAQILTF